MKLEKKTVLITGRTSGIGQARREFDGKTKAV